MTPERVEIRRELLLAALAVEDPITLRVIDAIPEDRIQWKPDAEKCRPVNELAIHAARAGRWFIRMVDGLGPPDEAPDRPMTKDALLAAARAEQSHYRERLSAYTADELAATAGIGGGAFTNIDVLTWHRDHMIHHRGQVVLYLRLMGAHVPSTYGPSGDEDAG